MGTRVIRVCFMACAVFLFLGLAGSSFADSISDGWSGQSSATIGVPPATVRDAFPLLSRVDFRADSQSPEFMADFSTFLSTAREARWAWAWRWDKDGGSADCGCTTTTAPEPGTLLLLAIGLGSLVFLRRRMLAS